METKSTEYSSRSDFTSLFKTAATYSSPSPRLTMEEREKKASFSNGGKKAFTISQEELDDAKAKYFSTGGTVKHLNSSGVSYAEVKEYLREEIDEQEILLAYTIND